MLLLWIVVLCVSLGVELLTTALLSIWFVIGSLAAMIAAVVGAPNAVQYIVFFAVSAISFLVIRPFIAKTGNEKNRLENNVERYIGKQAEVTEGINNIQGTGRVMCNGISWAAKSSDDSVIIESGMVTIMEVDGSKLTVKATSGTAG